MRDVTLVLLLVLTMMGFAVKKSDASYFTVLYVVALPRTSLPLLHWNFGQALLSINKIILWTSR